MRYSASGKKGEGKVYKVYSLQTIVIFYFNNTKREYRIPELQNNLYLQLDIYLIFCNFIILFVPYLIFCISECIKWISS